MTTLREAAQQALEAMEEATGVMEVHLDHYFEAMNVLRAALAEAEKCSRRKICERGADGYCARCHEEMYP